jgi:hypothetical protein
MASMERFGDIGRRELNDNPLVSFCSILWVLQAKELILSKSFLLLEDRGY